MLLSYFFLYPNDIQKYANDGDELMWNIATDPQECISNNKQMTPSFDVKLPFTLASNNDGLEKTLWNLNRESMLRY